MDAESDDRRGSLYLKYRIALVSYARPFVGSREEAEEVVQEAFEKLLPGGFKGIDTPIAYLRRTVRNLALNRRRRHRYEYEQATEHAPEWIQPLTTPSPERSALFNDQIRIVASVLETFPRQTRAIVEMHRFDGYTLEEIAVRLDLSVTTVHRILTAAMAEMTKLLSDRLK